MAVNLLRFTVSSEWLAKNSHPPHPGHFLRPSSAGSTLSLTYAHRPALPVGKVVFQHPAQEWTITGFWMISFRICWRELALATSLVIGVQPDLLFGPVEDTGGKPLLTPERSHGCCCWRSSFQLTNVKVEPRVDPFSISSGQWNKCWSVDKAAFPNASSKGHLHLTPLGCCLKMQIPGPTPAIDSLGPRNLHFPNILNILNSNIWSRWTSIFPLGLLTNGVRNWSSCWSSGWVLFLESRDTWAKGHPWKGKFAGICPPCLSSTNHELRAAFWARSLQTTQVVWGHEQASLLYNPQEKAHPRPSWDSDQEG